MIIKAINSRLIWNDLLVAALIFKGKLIINYPEVWSVMLCIYTCKLNEYPFIHLAL